MDKLRNLYKVNKKAILCILVITIIGIISGSIFYFSINEIDRETVFSSINTFFENIKNNALSYKQSLKSGLIVNFIYIFLIWFLGISIIGIPIVLILYFIKTFSLGFTLVSIISNYGFRGVIYSFIYIFPHNIISIITLGYLSIYAIACSFKMIEGFIKKKQVDFKNIMGRYKNILIITILITILINLYETFVMPYIMKFILILLK